MESEIQPRASRGFSLRSILLLVLLVGVGAGATAYAISAAFAASGNFDRHHTTKYEHNQRNH